MMRLHRIQPMSEDTYEVVLADDGRQVVVACRVREAHGIPYVEPEPGMAFWFGGFDPRPIVAAVIAFHSARMQPLSAAGALERPAE